jgi:23S rRNA (cytidine1920-2'-O)/16S rRNA (cytidine1409-2'-O)-methyltransferase
VPSRSAARRAIVEGRVSVAGVRELRPAKPVTAVDPVTVDAEAVRYVGRGGHKLAAALDGFGVDVAGAMALDIGSSTGGFTDCMLQRGAAHVVAVDVGTDQLHPTLRSDPRVTTVEQTDIRRFEPRDGESFTVIVADVSFVSLTLLAPDIAALGSGSTDWLVLVKPQFEAGPGARSRRGVVTDAGARVEAVDSVAAAFGRAGVPERGRMESPVVGSAGNVEWWLWLGAGAV